MSLGKKLWRRIWMRCYHPWLLFWLSATEMSPSVTFVLAKRHRRRLKSGSAALSFKIFTASHPERPPPLSLSLPLSFSLSSYFLHYPSQKKKIHFNFFAMQWRFRVSWWSRDGFGVLARWDKKPENLCVRVHGWKARCTNVKHLRGVWRDRDPNDIFAHCAWIVLSWLQVFQLS